MPFCILGLASSSCPFVGHFILKISAVVILIHGKIYFYVCYFIFELQIISIFFSASGRRHMDTSMNGFATL